MSSNFHKNPDSESQLDQQNAPPTYEESTGQVQPTTAAAVASNSVNNNLNEHLPLNSGEKPNYRSHSQEVSDSSPSFGHEEKNLQQSATIQQLDLIESQITQADLDKHQRSEKILKIKRYFRAVAIVLTLVFFVMWICNVLGSIDSTDKRRRRYRHNWLE